MSILFWLCGPAGVHSRSSSRRTRRQGAAPRLEVLEDRTLPSAAIWYVNGAATGSNKGQSWTNAFTDLQSALHDAQSGDQIWVAKGTYNPTSGTDRTISFVLDAGVAVYGGFAGTETQLSQRDWVRNVTTLSGGAAISRSVPSGPVGFDTGRVNPTSTNSYHVVTSSGLDASAILDGFTITSGYANGTTLATQDGGGMYNESSSPTLADLIFSGNYAIEGGGGGMYNESSSPTLTNVTFSGNSAFYNISNGASNGDGDGGGMYNNSGAPTLTDVTFSGNYAEADGGGIFNSGNLTLEDTIVAGNSAATSPDVAGGFTDLGHNLLGTALKGAAKGSGDVFSNTPLLAPLGNYGGPTQTMSLLPGSPAIGAGVAIPGITTDQRGSSLPTSNPDIGAFESHGFTLTLVSGSNQTAAVNTAFTAPLVVQVTSNDPLEPVTGGVVTFTVPASAASARLRTVTAVIGSHGTASTRATANGVFGLYAVTASSRGATGNILFELSNGTVTEQVQSLIAYIQSLISKKKLSQSIGTSLAAYLRSSNKTYSEREPSCKSRKQMTQAARVFQAF